MLSEKLIFIMPALVKLVIRASGGLEPSPACSVIDSRCLFASLFTFCTPFVSLVASGTGKNKRSLDISSIGVSRKVYCSLSSY